MSENIHRFRIIDTLGYYSHFIPISMRPLIYITSQLTVINLYNHIKYCCQ